MLSALPLALSGPEGAVLGAAIAATLSLCGVIYVNAVGRKRENDARRRDLYSNAYRAALEWCEGVYRVRRRKPDGTQDHELVERFHDLQERIAFHEGMLSTESEELGKAFGELLQAVMSECKPLLQLAWGQPGRAPSDPTPDDEKNPDLREAKASFCRAVRKHMAPWWKKPFAADSN
jgi:hypothetical protein